MYDIFKLQRNGTAHHARRFLRKGNCGAFFQSLFYENQIRCDPVGYPAFSVNEPAMQTAASKMFDEMLDQSHEPASADCHTRERS
jgi:hypothetical protein